MIINVNKEAGWTSFDVVAKARGILRTKKVGHAGTLDPLATGVLILLTDKDTKKQDEIMHKQKEYLAEVTFGIETPTYDLEMIPEINKQEISLQTLKEELPKIIKKYIGEIDQTAPLFSAKKVNGKVLYKLARKDIDVGVKLPVKRITIFNIGILDFYYKEIPFKDKKQSFPTVKINVTCSSGTYIRSLAHDLGSDLGCGAVLSSLIRTRIGNYFVEDSKTLSQLDPKELKS